MKIFIRGLVLASLTILTTFCSKDTELVQPSAEAGNSNITGACADTAGVYSRMKAWGENYVYDQGYSNTVGYYDYASFRANIHQNTNFLNPSTLVTDVQVPNMGSRGSYYVNRIKNQVYNASQNYGDQIENGLMEYSEYDYGLLIISTITQIEQEIQQDYGLTDNERVALLESAKVTRALSWQAIEEAERITSCEELNGGQALTASVTRLRLFRRIINIVETLVSYTIINAVQGAIYGAILGVAIGGPAGLVTGVLWGAGVGAVAGFGSALGEVFFGRCKWGSCPAVIYP